MSTSETTAGKFDARRLNLGFVAISLIFLEFCVLIFPLIERFFTQLGFELPIFTQVGFAQCLAVALHPTAALAGFATAYALLVLIGNFRFNSILNAIMLGYYAAILAVLGLPVMHSLMWPGYTH